MRNSHPSLACEEGLTAGGCIPTFAALTHPQYSAIREVPYGRWKSIGRDIRERSLESQRSCGGGFLGGMVRTVPHDRASPRRNPERDGREGQDREAQC